MGIIADIFCKKCNTSYSSFYSECPDCCNHKKISFDIDHHEGVYGTCNVCGESFDKHEIAKEYIGIKKGK